MKEIKIIYFELLGLFSYALPDRIGLSGGEMDYGDECSQIGDRGDRSCDGGHSPNPNSEAEMTEQKAAEFRGLPKKVGKKTLSFLQYLIVNHSRDISAEELIDVFWSEKDSKNPANALRNMLFKIRDLLKAMFPEEEELLQTQQGCYVWNPEVRIELDTERFERLCVEARESSGKEKRKLLREAVEVYKGEFLSGNGSQWSETPRQYYRTLYLEACKELLPLLEEQEQWLEIVRICGQAYQVDFCMEEFTAYQMHAFIAMGQPEQAVEKYETFKERILEELALPPTKYIEQIYTLAVGLLREEKGEEKEIFRLVCETASDQRAFLCSFEMFQGIVALEKRHLTRTGQTSVLVIVSLEKDAVPTTDARRLERILLEGLREGDPVARLTAGSYIFMLTGAGPEDAQTVTTRLDCSFHRIYRHSKARLVFRISGLCAEEQKKG